MASAQRAARFPPTGRGPEEGEEEDDEEDEEEDEEGGGVVTPSSRSNRVASSNPTKRQAIAPRQASAMKAQVELPEPPRAAVPKSMAA